MSQARGHHRNVAYAEAESVSLEVDDVPERTEPGLVSPPHGWVSQRASMSAWMETVVGDWGPSHGGVEVASPWT